MRSTYDLLGIPNQVAVGFVFISAVALFLPYFAGKDFGFLKFPRLSKKTPYIILGPVLLLLSIGGLLPRLATPFPAGDICVVGTIHTDPESRGSSEVVLC